MTNAELQIDDCVDSNGVYLFDPGAFWVGIVAAVLLAIGFGGAVFTLLTDRHAPKSLFLLIVCSLFSLAGIAFAGHISRFRGRTVQITSDGISVHDRHGNQIEGIHWLELGRVTERRKMAQIVLWDKLGVRRVFIDQQYKNFQQIRSRILDEYAEFFTPQPLPFQFRNSPLLYDSFVYAGCAAVFGWASQASYRQNQPVGSLILLCLSIAVLISILRFYPQLRGPSVLFDDRIVIRRLFKTEQLYKRDVAAVELRDITNPKSGTKFSLVVLRAFNGKELKITSIYGSVPETYLTLKAWLAHP